MDMPNPLVVTPCPCGHPNCKHANLANVTYGQGVMYLEHAQEIARRYNLCPGLVAALKDVLEQLDGIGIPDWHGAEGLDLSGARSIVAEAEAEP